MAMVGRKPMRCTIGAMKIPVDITHAEPIVPTNDIRNESVWPAKMSWRYLNIILVIGH
jgi:hypothetical protein